MGRMNLFSRTRHASCVGRGVEVATSTPPFGPYRYKYAFNFQICQVLFVACYIVYQIAQAPTLTALQNPSILRGPLWV